MRAFGSLAVIFLALLFSTGCATAPEQGGIDPYEKINRKIFAFNDSLDRNIVAPVARGYELITPEIVEHGVRNVFANLYDFNGTINAILQGRYQGAAQDGGRFLVNSTFGLLGLFDIASEMGIAPYRTDFDHTLSLWGMNSGPYLMLPFFGPRTVRGGAGFIFDSVASVQWGIDNWRVRVGLFSLEVIDTRADLLNAETLISGDRYLFVRDAYLQQREVFVNDGVIKDSFSEFDEGFDWEE